MGKRLGLQESMRMLETGQPASGSRSGRPEPRIGLEICVCSAHRPGSRARRCASLAGQNLTSSNRFAVVHLKMTSVGTWPQTPTNSSVSLSPYCLPEPM